MGDYLWPVGHLVLCLTPEGVPARMACREHIFRIESEARCEVANDELGAIWLQSAKCLVCEYVTPEISAQFWAQEAAPSDIDRCCQLILDERERLERVGLALVLGDKKPALRNFD